MAMQESIHMTIPLLVHAPDLLWAAGRFLLGGLFVLGGVQHFFNVPGLVQVLTTRGVPAATLTLLAGSAFQIVAGLALMFGIAPLLSGVGLAVFTVAASVMMMNFWDMTGAARESALHGWRSNIAIIGGLLVAASHGT